MSQELEIMLLKILNLHKRFTESFKFFEGDSIFLEGEFRKEVKLFAKKYISDSCSPETTQFLEKLKGAIDKYQEREQSVCISNPKNLSTLDFFMAVAQEIEDDMKLFLMRFIVVAFPRSCLEENKHKLNPYIHDHDIEIEFIDLMTDNQLSEDNYSIFNYKEDIVISFIKKREKEKQLEEKIEILEEEAKVLKTKIEYLEKEICYMPGGDGYHISKTNFEKLQAIES